MKRFYPKPSSIPYFIFCIVLLITALIIHSCKKDNRITSAETDVTDPNVAAAQAWYTTAYPTAAIIRASIRHTSGASIASSTNNTSPNWSKYISPYWKQAVAFTSKKGLNIVEAPVVNTHDMAFTRSMPSNLSQFDFSKSGSLTSMLIIKQGNQYAAYAMTILADSSYLKGDYTKLHNNTYRKKDKDFTGWVLYHRLDGTYVNGWRYINGVVVSAAYYNPSVAAPNTTTQGTQKVNSLYRPRVNVLYTCDITIVWQVFAACYYAASDVYEQYPEDCTYRYQYVGAYSTCSPSTDPGSDGSPSNPTQPPPCVPPSTSTPVDTTAAIAVSTRAKVLVKANHSVNRVAQPTDTATTTDPNGEITPTPLCPETTTTVVDSLSTDSLATAAINNANPVKPCALKFQNVTSNWMAVAVVGYRLGIQDNVFGTKFITFNVQIGMPAYVSVQQAQNATAAAMLVAEATIANTHGVDFFLSAGAQITYSKEFAALVQAQLIATLNLPGVQVQNAISLGVPIITYANGGNCN